MPTATALSYPYSDLISSHQFIRSFSGNVFTCRLIRRTSQGSAFATNNRSFISFNTFYNFTPTFSRQQYEIIQRLFLVTGPPHICLSPILLITLGSFSSLKLHFPLGFLLPRPKGWIVQDLFSQFCSDSINQNKSQVSRCPSCRKTKRFLTNVSWTRVRHSRKHWVIYDPC
jgi:hypothetical protein